MYRVIIEWLKIVNGVTTLEYFSYFCKRRFIETVGNEGLWELLS